MLTGSALPSTQFTVGIRSTASPMQGTLGKNSSSDSILQAVSVSSGTRRPNACPLTSNSRFSISVLSSMSVRRSKSTYFLPFSYSVCIIPTLVKLPLSSRPSGR